MCTSYVCSVPRIHFTELMSLCLCSDLQLHTYMHVCNSILWHIATSVMYSHVHLADKNPVWVGGGDNQVPKLAQGDNVCTYHTPWPRVQLCKLCTETWCAMGMQSFERSVTFSLCDTWLPTSFISSKRKPYCRGPSILSHTGMALTMASGNHAVLH